MRKTVSQARRSAAIRAASGGPRRRRARRRRSAARRWRGGGAPRDDLRQLDGEPAPAAVVDAPERGLQALAERDDRALGVAGVIAPDLVVEAAHAQRLPLPEAAARAEALLERIVDALHELDGERVLQDGVGPARFGGAMPERPQQRLGHAAELDAELVVGRHGDCLPGYRGVHPPVSPL
jgi:hypothetical protein